MKKTKAKEKRAARPRKPKRRILKRTKLQLLYDQIETLKPIVAEILVKDRMSRDDDNRLAIEVWKRQGMREGDTFKSFKFKLIMNKVTTPESIGRTRRLLQSKYADLRGSIYNHRKSAEDRARQSFSSQLKFF